MSTEETNEDGLSRRGFLWGAGAAAAGGGILAACGGDDDDDGGAAAGDNGSGDGSSDGGGTPTGGTIKIGYVTPQTGPLAAFGEADSFVLGSLREFLSDGIMIAGTNYAVEIIDKDSESNSNTAATAAQELIVDDGVQLMCVAQTPDTTVPVVQQCTNNEIPVLSNNAPWQPHYLGIGGQLGPDGPPPVASEWNYHFFWGLEDVIAVFLAMWNEIAPGATIGALWPDDPDGNAWSDPNVGFPPALEAAGYTLVDPGRFPLGGNDFTAQINQFKDAGVTIVTGVLPPPDFGNFWAQAQQQGLEVDAVTVGKGLLFPGAVGSFENPAGISTEIWWSDKHPTTSSLTGQSAAELAAEYEETVGSQWTQPVGYVHSLFEVAIDAITRAGGAEDKQALLGAMGETNLATIAGQVDFTNPVVPNVTKTPLIGGQWVPGDTYDYELAIRTNEQLPGVELDGPMESMRG